MARILVNTGSAPSVDVGASGYPTREPLAFHRRLPGYAPTPLVRAPTLARRLGVAEVLVKDESSRLGLPSFKVLGASWAVYRTIIDDLGADLPAAANLAQLRTALAEVGPRRLVTATDGNHGRAVARMAALLGWPARIYVPADMVAARRRGIAAEGAQIVEVAGGYDDAVEAAAQQATADELVIADTAHGGRETVPRRVAQGYSTIFWEIDDEIGERGLAPPTAVAVQIGVGALAAAAVCRYRTGLDPVPPLLIGVEPQGADCALASVAAGTPTPVPAPHRSIMAGLNCGRVSPVAWPLLRSGIDVFVAVEDDDARQAMRALKAAGVVSGESGAAGLAGVTALIDAGAVAIPGGPGGRDGRDGDACILLLSTEGATDPDAYAAIVGCG